MLILILLESTNRDLTTILRQVKIFPSPQYEEEEEDHQLGNQTEESKKHHLEENLRELNS